jgi:glycosyltransferase involved in cell wall biosynthesis
MMGQNKQSLFEFSLLIPAFNEEQNVEILMEEIRKTFRKFNLKGEVIFVDDGSNDDTFGRAVSQKEKMPFLKVIRHRRNFGKTEAIATGMKASESSVMIILDADLQYSPEEIPGFLRKIEEGYDIVTGRKVGKYQKRRVSYIYNRLGQKIFGVPVTDMNSMKAFRKEILDDLHLRHDWHRFFVALSYNSGYSVTEIDVKLHPRKFGKPKYTGYGRIIVGILDLLAVKFKITFVRKPLLFFGTIGFALIVMGIGVSLVAIYMRVFLQAGFRPLLYLVILLITVGFIAFIGGLLGEIIGDLTDRIEHAQKKLTDKNLD